MSEGPGFRERALGLWHVHRVKSWARRHLGMGAQCLITIAEVPCPDPACPGPATQISILSLDMTTIRWMVHKPTREICEADIVALLE